MSEHVELSAEVRELLGVLALDESANLLRVHPAHASAEARDGSSEVSSAAAFLSKAERRLLEVHREEVSRLLYRYTLLIEEQNPTVRAHAIYADGEPLPDRTGLDLRARKTLAKGWEEDASVEALLGACLDWRSPPEPLAVLAAAARVAPSPSIRILQGNDLHLYRDDLAGAERVLTAVLGERPSGSMASYAWEGLGLLAARRENFAAAASCYRAAVREDRERKLPKLTWLRFAFLSAREDETLAAASLASADVDASDPVARWYTSLPSLGNRLWAPPEAVQLRRRIDDRLLGVARLITDVEE